MADVNYLSYWVETDLQVEGQVFPAPPLNPKDFSDVLKFSNCNKVEVNHCTIFGGTENCSDAVRGSQYLWKNSTFIMRQPGKGALTIKGAIAGWTLDGCTFDGHGNEYDVELGQFDNYWRPFRRPTRGGSIINCGASDGRPIKVTVWDADMPVVCNSNVTVRKVPWFVWFPYFCFRAIQIRIQNIIKPKS